MSVSKNLPGIGDETHLAWSNHDYGFHHHHPHHLIILNHKSASHRHKIEPDERPAWVLTAEFAVFKGHNFFWTPDHWEPLKLSYFEQFLFCSIHKWQELNWLVWKVQSLPCQKHNLKPGGLRANHQDPLVLHPYLKRNDKVHNYAGNMRQTLAFINEELKYKEIL